MIALKTAGGYFYFDDCDINVIKKAPAGNLGSFRKTGHNEALPKYSGRASRFLKWLKRAEMLSYLGQNLDIG